MSLRALPSCGFALLAWLALSPAHAATSCAATMTSLNFPATNGAISDATATLSVTCTSSGLSVAGRARVNLCASIFSGTDGGGTLNPRRMINSFNDPLQMQLYTDAARSAIWGARGNATVPNSVSLQFNYSIPLFSSGSQTLTATLYGRIPAQTGLNAGTYANRFTGAADTLIEFRFNESAPFFNPTMPPSCISGGTAGTTSRFPFTVNGSVPNACTLTPKPVPDLAFGNVPSPVTANVDRTTAIGLVCTGRTAWQIGLDNGLNASGTVRRMRSAGGQFVSYELYRDSPRSLRWGSTLATDTLTGTGSGTAQSLTVYGRVAPQAPTVGTYSDTITVTVTY